MTGSKARKIVCASERDGQSPKPPKREAQAIRAELRGSNEARACGIVVRGHAPVLALCRKLIAAGWVPSTSLECFVGEVLAIRVRSLAAGAGLTVEDDRFGRPRFVRWRPRGDGAASEVAQIREPAT